MNSRLHLAVIGGLLALAAPFGMARAADTAVWAQDGSDLPADGAVLYGKLPNGMRYALMRNATPAKQISIRFRIGSGSLEETDAQQGLAHFLEHMAFKGSTHVPPGEMVKLLQRKGLAFGADTNAFTEWSQTVYALDLPENDDDMIDTGLMLMRETGSELLLDPAQFEPERGVVLSEERLRDTPAYRGFVARLGLLLDGQLGARRLPIGQVDILQHAPVDVVRDYYRANYRPERATLIMIGDFDPKALEAKIKARFTDWKPVGPSVAEPDLGKVATRGLTAKVVEVKGASTQLQVSWVQPYDASADVASKREREQLDTLAIGIFNQRLSKLLRSEAPPFLTASSSLQNMFKSARVVSIASSCKPDAWREALAAVDQEQRRIVDLGVNQEEVDQAVTILRTTLQQQADGAATRRTTDLASVLLADVGDNKVFITPAQNLALFTAATKQLKAADVNAILKGLFSGQGPVVQLSVAQPIEGGDAALKAEYQKAHAVTLAGHAADAVPVWPYTDFGTPGTVAERHDLPDAGAVAVRFANGVRLTVKPTKFRTDEVLVRTRVGDGRLDFPKDQGVVGWSANSFIEGGLEQITRDDIGRALASKIVGLSFGFTDQALELGGATRPQDLGIQLQLLTAYVTHPAFRPAPFERLRAFLQSTTPQAEATPGGVLSRQLQGLLHSGDPRWAFPSDEQLAVAKPEIEKALLQPQLASGPIEVTIVGDITVEAAIQQTAATFGTLPPRKFPTEPPMAGDVRFPEHTVRPLELRHKGRPDQAIAVVAWPLPDFYANRQQADVLDLADDILQFRLLEAFRIAEGSTYSPQGAATQSPVFKGYGYAQSMVETPPEKIASFYAHVSGITASMAGQGVSEDELTRAKTPRIEAQKKSEQTNAYWLGALAGVQADPRKLDDIRRSAKGYEQTTTADIQQAMRLYFSDTKTWKLVVLPTPAPK